VAFPFRDFNDVPYRGVLACAATTRSNALRKLIDDLAVTNLAAAADDHDANSQRHTLAYRSC